MSDDLVIVSRSIPITPGRKQASDSISVVLASDQPALNVLDAAAIPSDVKASMFGFPITEQRQFLLQELPNYGIDSSVWGNNPGGSVTYLPSRSCVNIKVGGGGDTSISTHQSKFAYKYQPGKQISISQAVQCSIGPVIENCVIEWGEFTKSDGYGWRVLTRQGTSAGSYTPWHNYLLFFRRTSAMPENTPTGVVQGDVYESTTNLGRLVNQTAMYRPAYLVGGGTNTSYINTNTWEEIAFTTLDASRSVSFNRDRYTGKDADGTPAADGTRGKSARQVSFISDSYQFNITSGNGSSITVPSGIPLAVGMTIRGNGIQPNTYITAIDTSRTQVTLSRDLTSNINSSTTIFANERSNLCMFLIQRSWYGGAGGRGLMYIPDQNPPYNGATRWVTGHEIRIGDTLPTPSMSNPDMPITYRIGKKANATTATINDSVFLDRFGVSVWIDGGDPRPATIESASATGITVVNDKYTPMLAIALKPFVYNSTVAAADTQRPQKSRAYPIKLYVSSTQNTEFYLVKGSHALASSSYFTTSNPVWYAQTLNSDLDPVAVASASQGQFTTTTINVSNGYPTSITGQEKLIGAFYCGNNQGVEFDLREIFDPQRELLGRAENVTANNAGDTLMVIARSLVSSTNAITNAIVSCSLVYGVQ